MITAGLETVVVGLIVCQIGARMCSQRYLVIKGAMSAVGLHALLLVMGVQERRGSLATLVSTLAGSKITII